MTLDWGITWVPVELYDDDPNEAYKGEGELY